MAVTACIVFIEALFSVIPHPIQDIEIINVRPVCGFSTSQAFIAAQEALTTTIS